MSHPLTVYYDGLCQLCSREIDHYRKHPRAHFIQWTDISNPAFNIIQEGLDLKEVHRTMHARKLDGQILKGIDSFLAIWEVLDDYHWLSALVNSRLGRPVFDFVYAIFARVRPYLPKRKRDRCEDDRCTQ